jgi:hypothetical protein
MAWRRARLNYLLMRFVFESASRKTIKSFYKTHNGVFLTPLLLPARQWAHRHS